MGSPACSKQRSSVKLVLRCALIVWLGQTTSVVEGQAGDDSAKKQTQQLTGIVAPWRMATLAAIQPGRVSGTLVTEGTTVQQGNLLFTLDDEVQLARTEVAKAAAESTLEVELARAKRDIAERELDRLMGLHGSDFATNKELSDARADTDIRQLEYEAVKFAHVQAGRIFARERALLETYRGRAPFDGYIARQLRQVGDTVDEQDGIYIVAQLDPLRVSIDCPTALASSIQLGDRLLVAPADAQWAPRLATVIFKNRVADGASQTFKLKLAVDNSDGQWISGLKVTVEIPVDSVAKGEINLHRQSALAEGK